MINKLGETGHTIIQTGIYNQLWYTHVPFLSSDKLVNLFLSKEMYQHQLPIYIVPAHMCYKGLCSIGNICEIFAKPQFFVLNGPLKQCCSISRAHVDMQSAITQCTQQKSLKESWLHSKLEYIIVSNTFNNVCYSIIYMYDNNVNYPDSWLDVMKLLQAWLIGLSIFGNMWAQMPNNSLCFVNRLIAVRGDSSLMSCLIPSKRTC